MAGMAEMMRHSIVRQGENFASLADSIGKALDSINKLALLSQNHHWRIRALEEGSTAH